MLFLDLFSLTISIFPFCESIFPNMVQTALERVFGDGRVISGRADFPARYPWRQGSSSTHLKMRRKKRKHSWLRVTLPLASDTASDPQTAWGWLNLFQLCWRPGTPAERSSPSVPEGSGQGTTSPNSPLANLSQNNLLRPPLFLSFNSENE